MIDTILGFVLGIVGSLITNAYSRFHGAINTACHAIDSLPGAFGDATEINELMLAGPIVLKAAIFELEMQNQTEAANALRIISFDLYEIPREAVMSVASIKPTDTVYIINKGDPIKMTGFLAAGAARKSRAAVTAKIKAIRPNHTRIWLTVFPFIQHRSDAKEHPPI